MPEDDDTRPILPANAPTAPMTDELSGFVRDLMRAQVFGGLTLEELRRVASCCTRCFHYRQEAIFEDADPGDDLYVIVRGRVAIRLESITPYYEIVLTSLGEGQVIGEMALLRAPSPRSATAVCSEPTETLRVDGAALRVVFREDTLLGVQGRHQSGANSMRPLAAHESKTPQPAQGQYVLKGNFCSCPLQKKRRRNQKALKRKAPERKTPERKKTRKPPPDSSRLPRDCFAKAFHWFRSPKNTERLCMSIA